MFLEEKKAERMLKKPEIGSMPSTQDVRGDGLTYLRIKRGALAAGARSEIRFSYRKSSQALTADTLDPVMPVPSTAAVAPPTSPAPSPPPTSAVSTTEWWPVYVAAALLVGLLAGMAFQRCRI